jgi:hypothetical protein
VPQTTPYTCPLVTSKEKSMLEYLIQKLSQMTLANWIAIASIFNGPMIAIFISIWYQNRKEKKESKLNCFLTLLSYRGYHPIPYQSVIALNQTNVLFSDDSDTLSAWSKYYNSLNQNPPNQMTVDSNFLDLLDSMAKNLGYKNLKQTQLGKYYSPQQYADNYVTQQELYQELSNFLKLSNSSGVVIRDYYKLIEESSNEK